jgi:hypothetical protein
MMVVKTNNIDLYSFDENHLDVPNNFVTHTHTHTHLN